MCPVSISQVDRQLVRLMLLQLLFVYPVMLLKEVYQLCENICSVWTARYPVKCVQWLQTCCLQCVEEGVGYLKVELNIYMLLSG